MNLSDSKEILVDAQVSAFFDRFLGLSPNQVIRLILGIDRDPRHEHSPGQFRDQVLREITAAGGSIKVTDLYARIEQTGNLLAGDYRGAEPHWQNRVRYLAESLRKEGVLKTSQRRGFWELEQLHKD
jgi:hypothetical protein